MNVVNDSDVVPPEPDLEPLVGDWLTQPDLVERLGVPLRTVRRHLQDRELIGVRLGADRVLSIPAKFITDDGPLPTLKGTVTVLSDGGMDDAEVIAWLFAPDDTLPVRGAPIDALRAGHKTEIRRRAQEMAL